MRKTKKWRPRKAAKWTRGDKLALAALIVTVALWLVARLLGG